ncbi:MAG TPA: polyhydroxyalkanoic acid system family protein [Candidatus Kapabacteria bacterium]|nr:polyhydroxyalkanoic acid system family protein [Candidatus Kapabacteria bacterium]
MATIHIRKEHARGREAARAAVEDIAANLGRSLGIASQWEGDTLRFHHTDATGTIVVDETSVTVDAQLGAMLSLFKGSVQSQIMGYLNEKL